ncbi:MAG TPA: GntR family transcriptional regulator [Anaerolineae bacterium]|nr:GntR family transcriptional regulator [Anaerolineae bacterium]
MNMTVNSSLRPVRSRSHTLTQVTARELRSAIEKGIYGPGTKLPPELQLVQMLGVSRTIVRDALRFLVDEGLIDRRPGQGTFVRDNLIRQNLNLNFGTTEMIKSAGMVPGTPHLQIKDSFATPEVAKALKIQVGTPIVTIERVRSADGKPVVYSLDYLAKSLVGDRDLTVYWRDHDVSLYQLLQGELGLVIEYGVTRLLPIRASRRVAEMLQVSSDSPLLYMVQTDYAPHDVPVLYTCEYHLPDAFDFIIVRRGPRVNDSA